MPRAGAVTFEQVAVTLPQDLVEVKGTTGKLVKIKRVYTNPTDTTLVTAQSISCRCRFLPATVTDGSSGSTPTPRTNDPGDSVSYTALANNTSKATTNGTAAILAEPSAHIYAGVDWRFPEGKEPVIGPAEAFVFELLSTVSGTVHLSGGVETEEMGG
jgi:hypothetical protein